MKKIVFFLGLIIYGRFDNFLLQRFQLDETTAIIKHINLIFILFWAHLIIFRLYIYDAVVCNTEVSNIIIKGDYWGIFSKNSYKYFSRRAIFNLGIGTLI